MINFKVRYEDRAKILAILQRAVDLAETMSIPINAQAEEHLHMSITACHANGTALDLDGLSTASDEDFINDIVGINENLDRDDDSPTGGKLLNGFVPKFLKA